MAMGGAEMIRLRPQSLSTIMIMTKGTTPMTRGTTPMTRGTIATPMTRRQRCTVDSDYSCWGVGLESGTAWTQHRVVAHC